MHQWIYQLFQQRSFSQIFNIQCLGPRDLADVLKD
uniref:Uncharacterized protein n=1 Tax=Rhizophora mucronata TaxID=61149 RepID=A0A2P2N0A8_RHIMU